MSSVSFAVKLYDSEPLKNGTFPIVLQIIADRKVRRCRLGLYASKSEFRNGRFRKFVPHYVEKNELIEDYEDKAESIYVKHFMSRPFDYKLFLDYFKQEEKTDFFAILDEYVETKRKQQAKIGTIIYYDETIRRAVQLYAGNTFSIKDITSKWLENFGYRFNSASYMRGVKAVLSYARLNGYIDPKEFPFKNALNPSGYDFKYLQKSSKKEPPIAYTEEDMKKWINFQPNQRQQRAYDIFMLSYYLFGCNLWDIIHFTDAVKHGDGIRFNRKKTNVSINMPLTVQAQKIFDKYHKGEYWFCLIDMNVNEREKRKRQKTILRSINRTLRRIAEKLGTDTRLTFYTARHTAATIAYKKGAPVQQVSALLGHTNIKTTMIYLSKFNADELVDTMELLVS